MKRVLYLLPAAFVFVVIAALQSVQAQTGYPAVPTVPAAAAPPTPTAGQDAHGPANNQRARSKNSPCSTEKVNHDCTLTIDRVNLLQPPTLQMYPNAVVTVNIANGLPFETPSLDWQSSTASLTPDPSSAILQSNLTQNLEKAVVTVTSQGPRMNAAVLSHDKSTDACAGLAGSSTSQSVYNCAAQLIDDAKLAAKEIGPLFNPDTVASGNQRYKDGSFLSLRLEILCRVFGPNQKKADGTTALFHAL